MVRIYIAAFMFFVIRFVAAQEKENIWYTSSPFDIKNNDRPWYVTVEIKNGILRNEISDFIDLIESRYFSRNKINTEFAIDMSVESSENPGIVKYKISCAFEYYQKLKFFPEGKSEINIQQIGMIDDKIVFVHYMDSDEIQIRKEILYEIMKEKFPKEYKSLKESVDEENKEYPVLMPALYHNVPYVIIKVKNREIIYREVFYE